MGISLDDYEELTNDELSKVKVDPSAGSHIYLASPHMSSEDYELSYIHEAFDTNWIAPLGKNVNEFENTVADYLGAPAAVALSSGTAAIHLSLKAAGVKPGDVVLCQSLTFSASANPILYEGATPVFVGSDETWNMNPVALEDAFKKYPNTKAVVCVHLYGCMAKIDQIAEVCRAHGAALIEDAAEALGSSFRGKKAGTFGDYGVISFNGNKIITTSGGGMAICNTKDAQERAAKIRFWATQSKEPVLHYQHREVGYNYRMSNVLAGIGRGQMKVLEDRVQQKNRIFDLYSRAFASTPAISMMSALPETRPNRWLTAITFDGSIQPADVIVELRRQNIDSRPIWKPLHLQPIFNGCDYVGSDSCVDVFCNGMCLPSDSKMTDEDVEHVAKIVLGTVKSI